MNVTNLVRNGVEVENERVLGNEIIVRDRRGFGKSRCATAEESCCGCGSGNGFVVETMPVSFTMVQQPCPISRSRGHVSLVISSPGIEDEDICSRDLAILAGLQDWVKIGRICENESSLGCAKVVGQFRRSVGWVGSHEDGTRGNDTKEQDGIVYLRCQVSMA